MAFDSPTYQQNTKVPTTRNPGGRQTTNLKLPSNVKTRRNPMAMAEHPLSSPSIPVSSFHDALSPSLCLSVAFKAALSLHSFLSRLFFHRRLVLLFVLLGLRSFTLPLFFSLNLLGHVNLPSLSRAREALRKAGGLALDGIGVTWPAAHGWRACADASVGISFF